jgi:hypothetical protein
VDVIGDLARVEADPTWQAADAWTARRRALADVAVAAELARHQRDAALAARASAASAALSAAQEQALAAFAAAIRAGERPLPDDPDAVDALLEALVGAEPAATVPLDRGMIHYEPSPAAVVLDALARLQLGPTDTLVDIGSGLGHVALVAHLWTGAQAIGLEIDPVYVARARSVSARLGLDGVRFDVADARTCSLVPAAAYFYFTPLVGPDLAAVVERIDAPIVSYGPGTPQIARVRSWASIDGDPSDAFRAVIFTPSAAAAPAEVAARGAGPV